MRCGKLELAFENPHGNTGKFGEGVRLYLKGKAWMESLKQP